MTKEDVFKSSALFNIYENLDKTMTKEDLILFNINNVDFFKFLLDVNKNSNSIFAKNVQKIFKENRAINKSNYTDNQFFYQTKLILQAS